MIVVAFTFTRLVILPQQAPKQRTQQTPREEDVTED
jgi:hypothetical protein